MRKVKASANEFLKKVKDNPFFLYVNFFDPHARMIDQVDGLPEDVIKPEDMPKSAQSSNYNSEGYATAPTRFGPKFASSYYNQVKRLDVGMGMLYEELRKAGKFENTLIIFVSDHALNGKTTCRDSGIRIPFLVRWPGNIREKYTSDQMITTNDIMPTVLAATGIDGSVYKGQGKSLLPLLKGEKVEWTKYAFGEMNFHPPWLLRLCRTVRTKNYRLTRTYFDYQNIAKEFELYYFSKNPLGGRNVAGKPGYVKIESELKEVLQKWQEQTDDPILKDGVLQKWIDQYNQALAKRKAKRAAKKSKQK